jgi:hypothetical protein
MLIPYRDFGVGGGIKKLFWSVAQNGILWLLVCFASIALLQAVF